MILVGLWVGVIVLDLRSFRVPDKNKKVVRRFIVTTIGNEIVLGHRDAKQQIVGNHLGEPSARYDGDNIGGGTRGRGRG